MTAQTFHDLDPFSYRGPEMPGSLHQVALEQVVWPDADLQQFMDQGPLNMHTIIDPGQKNSLVPQRDAGPGQPIGGLRQFRRHLVGMIDMDIHP